MEESLQLKIEHSSEFVREVEIPGQDAEHPLPDHTSNMMANTSTIPGGDSQMESEPQIESEFEAQLMASSNQHVENENKDAEFSWQADQSNYRSEIILSMDFSHQRLTIFTSTRSFKSGGR